MKKFIIITIILLLTVGVSFAGINDRFSNLDLKKDDPSGQPSSGRGWVYTKDDSGGTMRLYFENEDGTVNLIGTKRMIPLPIENWWTSYSRITHNTVPHYEARNIKWVNQGGITPAIVWNGAPSLLTNSAINSALSTEYTVNPDDSMISPALIQFQVPDYYQSGGEWVLWVQHEMTSRSANAQKDIHTTRDAIRWDYEYYIQTENGAWDLTPTKGTLVAQAANGYIDQISLSSASIAAGNVVQLRVWPTRKGQKIGHEKVAKKLLDAAFLYE